MKTRFGGPDACPNALSTRDASATVPSAAPRSSVRRVTSFGISIFAPLFLIPCRLPERTWGSRADGGVRPTGETRQRTSQGSRDRGQRHVENFRDLAVAQTFGTQREAALVLF